VAQHRYVARNRITDQAADLRNPRQVVVDAHRPAHEAQSGEGRGIRRDLFAGINRDDVVRDLPPLEVRGKIGRPFGGHVAENGNGFHGRIRNATA
jgi:hypothetical protein